MKLFLSLFLALIAAYALSCFLTIAVNPEVAFWNEANSRRQTEIAQIRKNQSTKPVIFFTGGSSTAFSIDPKIIEDATGHPTINLGLPVSCGARYLLHQALREAQSGDIIIVGTEPDLLTFPDQVAGPSKLAFALEACRGNFTESAGGTTFGESVTIPQYLTLTRPGPDYLITLAGRYLTGKGYRYKEADIKYRGLIQTPVRNKSIMPGGSHEVTALHPEGRELLETFAAAAKQKGVRLAYSMPWSYTATEHLTHNRANRRKILAEIHTIIPVLEDGYSGAMDNIDNFADGARHLSDKGSATRSKALVAALKSLLHP
ncbi:MAG: hypothetical protein H7Y36_03810 [Armatimonadetes bacterium]|nr:hypothetical protein [Akkermansiaceae bacterium]